MPQAPALEYGPHGIRRLAVGPGFIETTMTEAARQGEVRQGEVRNGSITRIPQGPLGTAGDGEDFEDFKNGLAVEETNKEVRSLHDTCVDYVDFSRSDY